MNNPVKLPFYAKLAFTLLSLISVFTILYIGQNIIIPILFGLLFAILLRPIAYFLKSKLRFPHVIASMFSVILFVMIIIGILFFLSWQIGDITNDWEKIKTNILIHFDKIQNVVNDNFNITKGEQKQIIANAAKNSLESGKKMVGDTLMSFTDMLLNLTLIPIYTFLFLLYRTHFIKFLSKLFKPAYHKKLQTILGQIKVSVQSYIIGLIIQMVSVATLTTIGFLIIGVKYAFLLGIIAGILNLIPYLGILFAGLLSIVATLTGSPDITIIIGVVVVIAIVQLIDNNLIVPLIVSSKVEINAFVSIVGIIIGGAISGVSGMFLAIPILAILKVIFDRIEPLEPWGYLMGDDLPKTYTWHNIKLPHFDPETSNETTPIENEIKIPDSTKTSTKSDKTGK